VDHERGDDRLGVEEESREVPATRLIQPGSRRAKSRSQCDRRYQAGGGERGDRRRYAYDDREREQLAQPVERGESARLVARPKRIIGYFNVGGLGPYFTLYENSRAAVPFKDPNVFGPFLVPPIVWLCQDLLLRRGQLLRTASKLIVLMLAVMLSSLEGRS
jgi:hypothetical protein